MNAPVLKTGMGASPSWVRIPPSPPYPTSGACKGRALKVDKYHHSHINIEIRLFATKNRDIDLLDELINRVDSRAKALLKKAAHVTVKLKFTPLTYLTGFYDPANPD